jgi:hypothetical protein
MWCGPGRMLILVLALTAPHIASSQNLNQPFYHVGGNWECTATFHNRHYEYSLEVKSAGPNEWTVTRTLLQSDDEAANAASGKVASGKIFAADLYKAHYSGYLGINGWFGEFNATSEIVPRNANPKD